MKPNSESFPTEKFHPDVYLQKSGNLFQAKWSKRVARAVNLDKQTVLRLEKESWETSMVETEALRLNDI